MKDTEYLKKMNALYEELVRISSAEPLDHDVWNDVHSRIMALHSAWYHSRRRRPWFAFGTCIFLLIILLWIVYVVLNVLYTKGIQ